MSALEQIRKRPAITIGIIGFALILFLFTGINGCDRLMGGDRETAAKVDGQKIKIDELRNAADIAATNYKNQYGQAAPDLNLITEQTLQGLIDQKLVDAEIERLGIRATDKEIQQMIYGQTALPYFRQMAQYYGFETMDDVYAYATSGQPGAENAMVIVDNAVEMLRQQLPQQKLQQLLGAINVNKLDAKAIYDASATTAQLTLARQDITTVADDQVNVTDDDVRRLYNSEKERYAIPTPLTALNCIVVNITPSEEDFINTKAEVDAAMRALAAAEGTEGIAGNYNFTVQTVKGTSESIADNLVKNNLDRIVSDTIVLFPAPDAYTIAKLVAVTSQPVNETVEIFAITDPAVKAAEVTEKLAAGTAVEEIEGVELQPSLNINRLTDPSAYLFEDHKVGEYFTVTDPNGSELVAHITEMDEPVTVYEIAKIVRPIEASDATYAEQLQNLTAYVAANTTAAQFGENAAESGFPARKTMVAPSNLSVLNLPSTTGAAKWATAGKKGQVSDVFTDDAHSYLLVMAIDDRFDDYLPLSNPSVADQLRDRLTAEKKAEKLAADLKGKGTDVESYAAAMNATPETLSAKYSNNSLRGFVYGDPILLAAIETAKKGEFVGPLATRNSVVVFTVDDITTSPREFDFATDAATALNGQPSAVRNNVANILRNGKKISYDLQRFYGN